MIVEFIQKVEDLQEECSECGFKPCTLQIILANTDTELYFCNQCMFEVGSKIMDKVP